MPRRTGKAVLQWLVDAEDVRSYVSCSSVVLASGGVVAVGELRRRRGERHSDSGLDDVATVDRKLSADGGATVAAAAVEWVCNGHPLCNCTTFKPPTPGGAVGLGLVCPQG
jgi:tRNA A37 threonylcarbamoyltransferase TsaD